MTMLEGVTIEATWLSDPALQTLFDILLDANEEGSSTLSNA